MRERALVIFAYDRPTYLQRLLRVLPTLVGLDDYDVWCFIDGPRDGAAARVDSCAAAAQAASHVNHVVRRDENLGVGLHQIDARRRLFEQEGYGVVVQIEDDVVPAPYALRALDALHASTRALAQGPVLAAHNFINTRCLEAKADALRDVVQQASLVCARFDGDVYDAVCDAVDAYSAKFLEPLHARGRPYKARNDATIRQFLSELTGVQLDLLYPTSQDACVLAACVAGGVHLRMPTVNHVVHQADTGEHVLPNSAVGVGCRATSLDTFDAASVVAALGDPQLVDGWAGLGSARQHLSAALLHQYTIARPRCAVQFGITPSTPILLGLTGGVLHTAELERAWVENLLFDSAARPLFDRWRLHAVQRFVGAARPDDALALTQGLPSTADLVLINAPAAGACVRAGARLVAPGGLLLVDVPQAKLPSTVPGTWQRLQLPAAATAYQRLT